MNIADVADGLLHRVARIGLLKQAAEDILVQDPDKIHEKVQEGVTEAWSVYQRVVGTITPNTPMAEVVDRIGSITPIEYGRLSALHKSLGLLLESIEERWIEKTAEEQLKPRPAGDAR